MNTDFLDAHHRHWHDAENLRSGGRWANADHLFGLVAECGLKRLMIAFGMKTNPDGSPAAGEHRKHADSIWTRYISFCEGPLAATSYPITQENPFLDWDVAQRYAHQDQFNQTVVDTHRDGADQVRKLIQNATLAGIL